MIAALGQRRNIDVWFVCFSYLWLHYHGSCGTRLSISTFSSGIHLWDEPELKMMMKCCVDEESETFRAVGEALFSRVWWESVSVCTLLLLISAFLCICQAAGRTSNPAAWWGRAPLWSLSSKALAPLAARRHPSATAASTASSGGLRTPGWGLYFHLLSHLWLRWLKTKCYGKIKIYMY